MTERQFLEMPAAEPDIQAALDNAADKVNRRTQSRGTPTELAAIALLFPVVRCIVTQFAMPWLEAMKVYSDVHKARFIAWVEKNSYQRYGIKPRQAKAAGEALFEEIQRAADNGTCAAWERLAHLLTEERDPEGP